MTGAKRDQNTHAPREPTAESSEALLHDHAQWLLERCGSSRTPARVQLSERASRAWAESGAMYLTGEVNGPPRLAKAPLAACMRGALRALGALTPERHREAVEGLDGAALLGERAALAGLGRRGATSPGGAWRLLPTADGWLALNLARPDDTCLLPALFECAWERGTEAGDVSESMLGFDLAAQHLGRATTAHWVARGRLLGLPIAPCLPEPTSPPADDDWPGPLNRTAPMRGERPPLVVDLSSLWAGPLCGGLLARSGARVIKVESSHRPDGARRGPARFFDLLNGEKEMVALDLRATEGVEALRRLLLAADIVVESARPRALEGFGIHAEEMVGRRPGLCWISITGYGRTGGRREWVAFGDDAGVAAGLSGGLRDAAGTPLFCGDAIADPITGTHAAVVALAAYRSGRGGLLDVSLHRTTQMLAALPGAAAAAEVRRCGGSDFALVTDEGEVPVAAPRARPASGPARALGADTSRVLAELGGPAGS